MDNGPSGLERSLPGAITITSITRFVKTVALPFSKKFVSSKEYNVGHSVSGGRPKGTAASDGVMVTVCLEVGTRALVQSMVGYSVGGGGCQ